MTASPLPPLAILAGGTASRMQPMTATVPKSMLRVAGEPFIAHQLRLVASRGVSDVVLCLGHLGQQVRDFVGNGTRFGLRVRYSWDGDRLLGTGGALRNALTLLGDACLVLYGDSYTDVPFLPLVEVFRRSGAPAAVAVYRNQGRFDTSNIVFACERVVKYDKRTPAPEMQYIDYGLALIAAAAFARFDGDGALDLGDMYTCLAARGELAGVEVDTRFYEIGSLSGLEETSRHLADKLMPSDTFADAFLQDTARIAQAVDRDDVQAVIRVLLDLRAHGGRLFFLGVGGGAGHAGHAVNDFRKICGIEAYAPTDNVSELTARINDDGWNTSFQRWLAVSRLGPKDCIFVFSVGGGDEQRNISVNIVQALQYARSVGARIVGVVGRDGGFTGQVADARVIVPPLDRDAITPHTEAFQAVVWHLLVSHPALRQNPTTWESRGP